MANDAHRIRLLTDAPPGKLLIHEIYRSLQGESSYAGLPCVFVRLSVCNSRCVWCDSPHSFTQGEWIDTAEVANRALQLDTPVIEITGGEPLLQAEVHPLMRQLADAGRKVLIETSGALDIGPIDPRVHIIMDLKCPDSGECEGNRWANLDLLKPTDEIKFVIASRRDFDWATDAVKSRALDSRFPILFSPAFHQVSPLQLAQWLLESRLNVRMQIQIHKYIWDPSARGV